MSLSLTPYHTLTFSYLPLVEQTSCLQELKTAFDHDWRQGWFQLAARKYQGLGDPSFYFWQTIAAHYLTLLCHLPAEVDVVMPMFPAPDMVDQWISRAPPMQGGEYLNANSFFKLWSNLENYVTESVHKELGVHAFLSSHAPLWRQVGKVCFHLAENKNDPKRPFAFLATYSSGFSSAGKLQHLPLGQALKQYAGNEQKQALINLLRPVQNASEKCSWVQDLISSGEIYQPLAWTANKAYQFLNSTPTLEECGLSIRIPNWWKQRKRPKVAVTIGSRSIANFSAASLLDFNIEMSLGDICLSENELSTLMDSTENLISFKGEWIEIDKEKLTEALNHWKQVQRFSKNGSVSFIEGMRLLAGAPINMETISTFSEKETSWVNVTAGEGFSQILQQLRDPSKLACREFHGVQATLRHYQKEGVNWLHFLVKLGLGACLADDMGLGKTLQILTLLQSISSEQKENVPSRASLLVVPASLVANWKQEAARFTPSLKILMLHPSEMPRNQMDFYGNAPEKSLQEFDLVVTTYSMLVKCQWLSQMLWRLVILDEAQAIKNSDTKQARMIKTLQSQARIALTGTPIENRLSDLWSLFDFLNPKLLGSAKEFKQFTDALPHFEPLRKLVGPYILRRMKTDPKVISDLPDKVETPTYCYLSKQQAALYQSVVEKLARTLEDIDAKQRRGIVLKALLELKQICNHPDQYVGNQIYRPDDSGKFSRLKEICEELAERQEKVLVFTQFSEIIPALESYLSNIFGRPGFSLHGGTPIAKRKELVHAFQTNPEVPYFVLSIKAGGTGLTLTAANHVIHFDRWWNPAVENQATDRAFRIGQKKNVQVHKFITLGTIEEKIDEIIASKAKLASDLFASKEEISLTELSDQELINTLTLNIEKITDI